MNFKVWCENKDIFGFPFENIEKLPEPEDDLPVKNFNIVRLSERLEKNDLNGRPAFQRFINEMQWGNETGAIRVTVTPKLNLKIQRMCNDKEGNPVFVMKKYFYIDDKMFGGREDEVADEIFDQVKLIASEKIENTITEPFDISKIAYGLAANARRQNYNILEFDTIKRLNENEYDVFFWLRGGGVGSLVGPEGQRPALAFVIKTHYNEQSGLIKVIGEFITSVDDSTSWQIQPAEFQEFYLPSQSKSEIIESILTSLKFY